MGVLCIDIGNSNISCAYFEKEVLKKKWNIHSDLSGLKEKSCSGISQQLCEVGSSLDKLEGVAIASVVPRIQAYFIEMAQKLIEKPWIEVSAQHSAGMTFNVDEPDAVGADRIANAVAGYRYTKSSVIILDFGTATTIDWVDTEGCFQGGMILPGFQTMSKAAASSTALLPVIDFDFPQHTLGKNTKDCLKAGIVLGYLDMVRSLVQRIQEVSGAENSIVLATGGLAEQIAEHLPCVNQVVPQLTLEGVHIIYQNER